MQLSRFLVFCCFMFAATLGGGTTRPAWSQSDDNTGEQAAASPAVAPGLPLYPLDVVVDGEGSAYVVDRNLHGVWKYDGSELTVLFEGSNKFRTPLNAPWCIALDKDGSLLVGDSATRDIYRLKPGGKPEPITGGKIGIPKDIAVASDGTLYVADAELRVVMKIPAGSTDPERFVDLNPAAVAIDSQDRLWVLSKNSEQVQIVDADGNAKAVVSERVFSYPNQIVVNDAGEAFVTDGYSKAVWKLTESEAPKQLVSGEPLVNPVGLARSEKDLLVVDPRARTVFKVSPAGELTSWFEISR